MTTSRLVLDLGSLRRKWGWFLALGISLIVLGIIALSVMPAATMATVMVLGWLMVFSGAVEAVHGFQVRGWGGMFLHLVAGILGVLIGLLIATHPVAGALAWTLLFASFFTVIGIFRMAAAIRLKFPNWAGPSSTALLRYSSALFFGQTGPGRDSGSWACPLGSR
jgi:uncharacterized membrane protein HdeD (DUF308 family)